MKACSSCGCYCRPADPTCPHCGGSLHGGGRAAAAVLLGLSLSLHGCVTVQSKYGVPDTGAHAEYGVPDTGLIDSDGDGWTPVDGDCNDEDDQIHPEATETAGDGVDSNCNDDDNT